MIGLKSKIYVAGHNGLVGSSILRKLKEKGYKNIIYADSKKLDLTNQNHVFNFLKKKKPSFIFIAAAKVGGIYANNRFKAEFIQKNLAIQTNIIHSAYLNKIYDLIFLGSSCVYPKKCKQPIKEKYLLTGPLEETNDAYAIAKIAGIKMCQSYNNQYKTRYKCLMPTNTYGPNDNYHGLNSHFFPALIKKIHKIKLSNQQSITIWGNGRAKRELIFVDDLAEACVYFMNKKVNHNLINIGTGIDQTVKQYTEKLLKTLIPDRKVKIKFDLSKPNGTPRKLLDVSLAKKYGWSAKTDFTSSIIETYNSYLKKK
tara:strand:- start:989 stop:1924 length:936 start_codon:yes stop_codon:yes gene_type:complete